MGVPDRRILLLVWSFVSAVYVKFSQFLSLCPCVCVWWWCVCVVCMCVGGGGVCGVCGVCVWGGLGR